MNRKLFLTFLCVAGLATTTDLQAQSGGHAHGSPRGWTGYSIGQQIGLNGGAPEPPFIQQVIPGSPADKAGLKAGDVIVKLNGKPATLQRVVSHHLAPGDTVRLHVRRAGREWEQVVIAAERPARVQGARSLPGAVNAATRDSVLRKAGIRP